MLVQCYFCEKRDGMLVRAGGGGQRKEARAYYSRALRVRATHIRLKP